MNISDVEYTSEEQWIPQIFITSFKMIFDEKLAIQASKRYWISCGGPTNVIFILVSYLLFVAFGQKIMKNRKPFELKNIIFAYNSLLILINFYFFIHAIIETNFLFYLFETKYPECEFSGESLIRIDKFHVYVLSKFLDMFDTMFFVLRKKQNQITFLHLYHHSAVPFLGYVALVIRPNVPAVYLFMFINSFIHVLMYTYYTLASFGPKYQGMLWWKKYITQLQLAQFALYLLYGIVLYFFQTGYPTGIYWIIFFQIPLFLYMFYDFYQKAYVKPIKQKTF